MSDAPAAPAGARERAVALYDYKAQRTVELSFSKGDVIDVISKDGPWWVGELRGVKGKLPSNYIAPEKPLASSVVVGSPDVPREPSVPTWCVALYPYAAQRDIELSFEANDIIQIVSNKGKWWDGELKGRRGKFPSNYVSVRDSVSPVPDIPPPPGPPPPVPGHSSLPQACGYDLSTRRGSNAPPVVRTGSSGLSSSNDGGCRREGLTVAIPQTSLAASTTMRSPHRGPVGGDFIPPPSHLKSTVLATSDLGEERLARLPGRERGVTVGCAEDLNPIIQRSESTVMREEALDGYMRMMKFASGFIPELNMSTLLGTGTVRATDMDSIKGGREYPFLEPDGPNNLRADDNNEIVAATLPKIIEKLTDRILPGAAFVQAFLLTYRAFTDARTVLELLVLRYTTPPTLPDDLQETIQIRVWYFLREWITGHFYDWSDEPELFAQLEQFIDLMCQSTRPGVASAAQQLKKLVLQKGQSGHHTRVMSLPTPKAISPSGDVKTVLDINPIEAARQLSLMEFEGFSKIKPKECFNLAWTKRDSMIRSPNVVAFIRNFNKVNGWVMGLILLQKTPQSREKVMKHFLKIADACKDIQNYNSMMEIVAALANSAIARLKKSWTAKVTERYQVLESFMEKNFKALRELLAGASPPCVPYIGLYFTDLVFIEEGNPNFLKDAPNLVNWTKVHMTAGIIQSIQRFQAKGYQFQYCQPVHQFIVQGIERYSITERQAYDQSLILEPREKH
eukprot:m51a1_g1347 hypothetical protein (736) ;mRNA; f:343676-346636